MCLDMRLDKYFDMLTGTHTNVYMGMAPYSKLEMGLDEEPANLAHAPCYACTHVYAYVYPHIRTSIHMALRMSTHVRKAGGNWKGGRQS